MKSFQIFLGLILISLSFSSLAQDKKTKLYIDNQIKAWHQAASNADFKTYTDLMTEDAIFIGTDPTENWQGEEFLEFAKPYFDQGKAWSFSTLERHIFLSDDQQVAWFDELLDTQMGICRGSGVLVNLDGKWKIKHYVLSITIPNENVDQVKALKKEFEVELIEKLKN